MIAFAIALSMDWEKPYWAAWTAFSIGLATRGEGLEKGLHRLAGGLVGAVVGLLLLAFFIQDRWLFIAVLSVYAAGFTYFALGSKRYNYFWQQAGFFATVVAFDSAFQPANAFEVGIERAQETGAGLIAYLVVSLLLWPENSRRNLDQATSKLVSGLRQLWEESTGLLSAAGEPPRPAGSGEQISALQAQFGRFLSAAESDSWDVGEVRAAWHSFQAEAAELNETLSRWRSDLDAAQLRNFERLIPGWRPFIDEIDQRLAETERLIAGHTPGAQPVPQALEIDAAQLQSLPHFDRAGLIAQRYRLQRIETLTRSLVDSARGIRGLEPSSAGTQEPRAEASFLLPASALSLDRDHLDEALRVAASVWLMFLTIVYVPDIPAGLGALGIATRLVLADTAMVHISLTRLFAPAMAAMACAFPFYMLLMPMLSSFAELAVAVAVVVFTFVYIFHEPRQALLRTLFAYLFFTMISVSNDQSYSFMHYATTASMWLVVLSVLTVTEYLPVSHQPDRVFQALLKRFFRSCDFLLKYARTSALEHSPLRRLQAGFYVHEVATLPAKLAQWATALPSAALGSSSPAQLTDFVKRLQGLGARMQALLEARSVQQSAALVEDLGPDMQAWRTGVEDTLHNLALEPESLEHQSLQARLEVMLSRLEVRIQDALNGVEGQALTGEESVNMYRLLSAHRGVSESLVRVTEQATELDWARLREPQF